jgi:Spy/CpxP family protein refolding chaperone
MKTSALALALLCAVGTVMAQRPPGPPNPAVRLERLATLLDLTDAQKAKVKTVLDGVHAKMQAQAEATRAAGTKPTLEQLRALREQRKAEAVKQLTPVLNPTQLKKFEVLMDEESEHGPRGGPHDPGPRSAPAAPQN